MNIRAFKDFEVIYNTEKEKHKKDSLSNNRFIISIIADNLDISAKLEIVRQLLKRNSISCNIEAADTDKKFLIDINKNKYCISFYQVFCEPDRVIRYVGKKLKTK